MSELEERFLLSLRVLNVPPPEEREYGAIASRKYRWDFAYPSARLLIEIQGAVFKKGAHSSGVGVTRDITKANIATLNGWRVLAFTGTMVNHGIAARMVQIVLTGDKPGEEVNQYGTKRWLVSRTHHGSNRGRVAHRATRVK